MGSRKTVNKKTLQITILEHKWKFTFWTPELYEKKICDGSKGSFPDYDKRIIHFDLSHLTTELMRHELTHCYAKERSIVELQIKKVEQSEEFFCEINGKYGEVLCRQARHLYRHGRKIKWNKKSTSS